MAAEAAEQRLAALRRRRVDAHHDAAPDIAEALALHHAIDRGDAMGEVEAGEVELVVGLAMTVEKALQAPALVVAETVPAHRRLTCRSAGAEDPRWPPSREPRSEEHTSELQSLMRT